MKSIRCIFGAHDWELLKPSGIWKAMKSLSVGLDEGLKKQSSIVHRRTCKRCFKKQILAYVDWSEVKEWKEF